MLICPCEGKLKKKCIGGRFFVLSLLNLFLFEWIKNGKCMNDNFPLKFGWQTKQ